MCDKILYNLPEGGTGGPQTKLQQRLGNAIGKFDEPGWPPGNYHSKCLASCLCTRSRICPKWVLFGHRLTLAGLWPGNLSSAVAKKKIIESIWGGVGAASEQKTGEDQMVSLTLYDSYFSKRGVDGLCVCDLLCFRMWFLLFVCLSYKLLVFLCVF